ncbi:polysaccharide export protein [Aureibaculum marinum]|uniref:Polysaccharide export protein n=1 Tax=Aureibaculum marinum TaxID=2487930 RepID=A0A3N4NRE6_9FLAO|nr:polysaccharide biosynthesis/export family protein [Aureibaculum marinum]RPD98794.1 polysaccharide export protein [Aureibaculum marinum]
MIKKPNFSSLKKGIILTSLSILLFSCGSRQDIVYFQDADMAAVSRPIENYNPIIKPDDALTITVSSLDLEGVRPFNLSAVSYADNQGAYGGVKLQSYLVDSNGNIDFPVLGKLKLAGLTRIQATAMIEDMLKEYLTDAIVIIRNVNFKVSVLGEVNRPGVYTIENDRITILEALAMAGDLTINAERHNVLVIREEGNKKTYNRVNLTSEQIFNSPLYYLTQNDVIYVTPNNSRIKGSTIGPSTGTTLTAISILITATALVFSITK